MNTVSLQKDVPVVGEYDIIVCGGGPSGIMAAIAAAREGARVALIERYGFVGGMATAALVAPVSVFMCHGELVIGGIPWELIQRMVASGDAQVEYPLGNISFRAESMKLVAQRMLLEAGVTLYLHAYLSGCQKDADNRVTHVVFESKSGTQALGADYIIDCTGDGDILAMAGVPMQKFEGAAQPSSLCFLLGGVDTDRVEKLHHSQQGVNYHIEAIQSRLRELAKTEDVPNFGGPWMCWTLTKGQVMVNATRIEANMLDEREQTRAECQLREDVHRLVELLRENSEPFKDAYLIQTAPQVGVRETRHMHGAHILTGEEYVSAVQFEDAIGRGSHPIDIHNGTTSEQVCQFMEKPAYIPYRCLYAQNFPNLLVGGRCFSADRVSSASVRVMASMMGLGQAAGVAAAQCANKHLNVADVDIVLLRERLIDMGANI